MIVNGQKKWIQTEAEFNAAGYSWANVKTVSLETLNSYPDYSTAACQYKWWFDSSHTTCAYSQFCGAYMYLGLQTFDLQTDCQTHLSSSPTPSPSPSVSPSPTPSVSPTATASPSTTPTPSPSPISGIPNGSLIKSATSPKVYVIVDNQKKWIQTAQEFNQAGYKWSNIQIVSSETVAAFPDYSSGVSSTLIKGPDNKVYKVINNLIIWVPSIEAFNTQGLSWSQVQSVTASQLNQYGRIKLIRGRGDYKVYYVTESSMKRHIPSVTVFNSYGDRWEEVVEVNPVDILSYPNNTLIKLEGENNPKVYLLENGKKRWIQTAAAFNRLKYDWTRIAPLNQTEINTYPEGTVIK